MCSACTPGGRGFGTAKAHGLVALATPLLSMVKRPFPTPLKVVLLIHSVSAAVSVEWGPCHGAPGVPP